MVLATYLVRTAFGYQAEISNVDGLGKASFVGSVEDRIQGNVLKDLVDPQLVRVEHHLASQKRARNGSISVSV